MCEILIIIAVALTIGYVVGALTGNIRSKPDDDTNERMNNW